MNTAARDTSPREAALSRGDTWGVWILIAGGVAIAAYTAVRGVMRIMEILRNVDVPVAAEFTGTTVPAPIGADGAELAVALQRAELTVSGLPGVAVAAGVLQAAVAVLATATVVALLARLGLELTRGRIFSARNTRLATAAGFVWIAGAALTPFLGNLLANEALAQISDGHFDSGVVMTVDLQTLVAVAFVAAFVASVFAVGERLRRDTEGLV